MSEHTGPEAHPIAELFPLIEGKEFEDLVEDIRRNGQRTPILLDNEGRILDGRNRLRACRAAGVEPRFESWDGKGSALEVVVSLNVRRRHLNESQRAMLAARLKEVFAVEARQRMIAGKAGDPVANLPEGRARDRAARLLNVSPRLVQAAANLLKGGDDRLVTEVESGKLAVSAAVVKAKGGRRRSWRWIHSPRASEIVLALWAPAGREAETITMVEGWGFKLRGKPEPGLPVEATRRNPLAGRAEVKDGGGGEAVR